MAGMTEPLPEGYFEKIKESRQRAEDFWAGTIIPTPEEIQEALTRIQPDANWWEREEALAIRDAARIRGLISD